MQINTVLFDLDGTLLDTAPDLADALNTVLVENWHEPLPYATIRGVVSHGGMALIKLGFGLDETSPEFEPLRQRLLSVYRDNLSNKTAIISGGYNIDFSSQTGVTPLIGNVYISHGNVTIENFSVE